MNAHSDWVSVRREDGETIGFLEPVTEEYDSVQPRTVLGHALGEPTDFSAGEERLLEHGIAELAEPWVLDACTETMVDDLTIIELTPRGIRLADRMSTKALVRAETVTLPWPDLDGRLTRR